VCAYLQSKFFFGMLLRLWVTIFLFGVAFAELSGDSKILIMAQFNNTMFPPTFDPEVMSPKQFLSEYTYYARAGRWTQRRKIQDFRHYLLPQHRPWYDACVEADGFVDFEDLQTLFLDEFKSPHDLVLESQLVTRVLKLNEPIRAYVQDKISLCEQVNPNMTVQRQLEHVLLGLPPEWRATLQLRSDLTLANVLPILQKYKENVPVFQSLATVSDLETKLTNRLDQHFNEFKQEVTQLLASKVTPVNSGPCLDQGGQQNSGWIPRCYHCNKMGHIRRNCPGLTQGYHMPPTFYHANGPNCAMPPRGVRTPSPARDQGNFCPQDTTPYRYSGPQFMSEQFRAPGPRISQQNQTDSRGRPGYGSTYYPPRHPSEQTYEAPTYGPRYRQNWPQGNQGNCQ